MANQTRDLPQKKEESQPEGREILSIEEQDRKNPPAVTHEKPLVVPPQPKVSRVIVDMAVQI